MLLFTIPFGGLLLMMGHHSREEALFYYFRLEDQVPENHLLRLIDRHVDLDFIRAKLKNSYSDMGHTASCRGGRTVKSMIATRDATCHDIMLVAIPASPTTSKKKAAYQRNNALRFWV
jgi:hypothetical protein